MGKPRIIAGIDVGSSKVCALVAEVAPEGLNILAACAVGAAGIQRGAVVDVDKATAAISRALDQVAAESKVKIGGVLLALGGDISSVNTRGTSSATNANTMLTADDARKAVVAAVGASLPPTREILHAIPRVFRIDGQREVNNPAGLFGRRVDAEVHAVTANAAAVKSMVSCFERLGVAVEEVVAKPLAASEAVVSAEERELGVVVADIGLATSGLTVFVDGSAWHTTTLPIGGRHITQDVATVLGLSFDVAEDLKLSAGQADLDGIDSGEELEALALENDEPMRVPKYYLCQIIQARVNEILALIAEEINRSGYAGLLPCGLVLTGGTSSLAGLARAASSVLEMRVRVGRLEIGASAGLQGPAYAAAIGLLVWRTQSSANRWWTYPRREPAAQALPAQRSLAARFRAVWSPVAGLWWPERSE